MPLPQRLRLATPVPHGSDQRRCCFRLAAQVRRALGVSLGLFESAVVERGAGGGLSHVHPGRPDDGLGGGFGGGLGGDLRPLRLAARGVTLLAAVLETDLDTDDALHEPASTSSMSMAGTST